MGDSFSTAEVTQYCGDSFSTVEVVQYSGDNISTCRDNISTVGVFSTVGDTAVHQWEASFSIVGDTFSTVEVVQYSGG